jgi:hypothetical protein
MGEKEEKDGVPVGGLAPALVGAGVGLWVVVGRGGRVVANTWSKMEPLGNRQTPFWHTVCSNWFTVFSTWSSTPWVEFSSAVVLFTAAWAWLMAVCAPSITVCVTLLVVDAAAPVA